MRLLRPVIFYIALLLLLTVAADSRTMQEHEMELLDKIVYGGTYDKRIRPPGLNESKTKDPTIVSVNMYIRSIDSIDDRKMEHSMQLTFRMSWMDNRLAFENSKIMVPYLTVNDPSSIWMPDLFFSNEKEAHLHELLLPNRYLKIFPDGMVLFSQRISLTLACPMVLRSFPMDTQSCSLRMASYGYSTEDIILKWKKENPVQVMTNQHLPGFALTNLGTDYCHSYTNTGVYSCIRLDLKFKREFSYYFTQVYIPCTMLVLIAWLSFWIDPKQVVGRITVTLVTLLVLAVQTSELNKTYPQVSYTRAIDVWTGTCLTFVFGSFVEFILVHYLSQWEENSPDKDSFKENQGWKPIVAIFTTIPLSGKIDIGARILYPILFVLFNFFYWSQFSPIE